MKISSLNHSSAPRCPRCRAKWRDPENPQFQPCACVRFVWSDGADGAPSLDLFGDWPSAAFKSAYRAVRAQLHQEDILQDSLIGSPERQVFEHLECADVGEVLVVSEHGLGVHPLWKNTFIGLRPKRRSSRAPVAAAVPPLFASSLDSCSPAWAAGFVGRKFDSRAARAVGWSDQGSADAHYGVAQGNNVWMFKIDDQPGGRCGCGHVWWRFLLVKLAVSGRVAEIRTEIHQIYPDGRGELICDEFLPHDESVGREALEAACGAVPAS